MSVTVQFINTGSSANAGNGDSLRTAFNKINSNFLALSTSSGFTLGTATNTTLGGVKIGVGLTVSNDGTISATGSSAGTEINVLDQNSNPSIDIVSYSGSTTLASSSVEMFTFDKTIYRSATIDVSARNESNSTDDVASAFSVTWNAMTSNAWGLGAVAMDIDGHTTNAEWDLECSNLGNDIRIKMRNATGSSANGHVINWRAKVNLFRL
jgi:hypothetical protein